jgi:serine/threonine-protein kinase HipA
VLPLGADPETERDAFLIPFRTSDLEFRTIRDRYFGSQASGIPGVQDKISSKMLSARVKTAGNDYILKLNPETIPFAAENENFFLGLANKCGIATARFDLLEDSIGEHALRLKRFDRINKETGKIRLAAEDGCQVMNIYPSEKYDVDFVAMAKALIEICPARGAAGFNLFKQLVFNWLIGNGDAHAKNFSILESESGEWMISPAYDLLCTRFYEDRGDREMALGIRGEKTGWTRKLLLEVANELYVPQKAAEKVIDKQLAELGDLPDQILDGSLPFARHLRNDVHTFLAKRAKSLAAN